MTATAYKAADSGSGVWGVTGGTALSAVAADDGLTSYISHVGDGTDRTTRLETYTFAFSGPANAVITRVNVRYTRRSLSGNFLSSALGFFINATDYGPTQTVSGTFVQATGQFPAFGLTFNGAGSFTLTLDLYVGNGTPGGDAVLITQLDAQLEYNQSPTAPTLTAPSGTVSGILPTFTGTHNDPDGDAMGGVVIEVRRVSDNALMWASGLLSANGTSFSKGYTGTTLVSGTQYKWRAQTMDNSGASNALGAWSGFTTFTPVVNTAPTAALVSPISGATTGSLTPTLQFSYNDPDGDVQSGYQIQVRRVSDQVSFWDSGQVASASTSVTYAGTALVAGTSYEWRARVQDAPGAWSNYTGWDSFVPNASPNPPTGITPSGLQNTLTPTVSGTYNQATGGAQAGYQYELRQNAVVIYASGDVAGAFGTGQAYGTNNPSDTPSAPPALAWGTSYEIRARSKDTNGVYSAWSAWQAFSTNAAPTTPTNLSPSGGAVTGDTTPTLSWQHNDPNGDAQTEAEIELRKVSDDSVVVGYGPKALSQAGTTHDVTATLTASPATAYKWRVGTKATAGPGFSPWSDWATFTVATAPVVTVSAPLAGAVVGAPALSVQWSMSGGSGTQATYQVRVFASDQTTILYDSTALSGTATSLVLPTGILRNNQSYYVQVLLTDTLAQAAASSKIGISTSWTPPATIVGLSVVAVGDEA